MAQGHSEPVEKLIEEFAKLPGIGPRSAERLAYHLLRRPTEEALKLAVAIRDVKKLIHPCATCGNLDEVDPCSVCADSSRDHGLVLVVETPKDLAAMERSGAYRGIYHVLGGRIAPLDGLGAEDIRVVELIDRVRSGDEGIREVILATNPDMEGDGTALHLREALRGCDVLVTRIARGIPTGSSIEYASSAVLSDALDGRSPMDR